jgi:hypothetical protein
MFGIAKEPIIGQETTTSRFEAALARYRQEKDNKENKPKIVWVNGKAQLAEEVGFDSIDEFSK